MFKFKKWFKRGYWVGLEANPQKEGYCLLREENVIAVRLMYGKTNVCCERINMLSHGAEERVMEATIRMKQKIPSLIATARLAKELNS